MKPITLQRTRQHKIIYFFVVALVVISLPAIFIFFLLVPTVDGEFLLGLPKIEKIWTPEGLGSLWILLLFFMGATLIPLMAIHRLFIVSREKLIIDETGIHYRLNFPSLTWSWFAKNMSDFSINWSLMTSIDIHYSHHNNSKINSLFFRVNIKKNFLERRFQEIDLCEWVNAEQPSEDLYCIPNIPLYKIENDGENPRFLYQHPLVEPFIQKNIAVRIHKEVDFPVPILQSFNIYSVVYYLFYLFLIPSISISYHFSELFGESLIDFSFIFPISIIGIFILASFGYWVHCSEMVFKEKAIFLVIIGLVLIIMSPPMALTLNYLTDKNGLQTYQYHYQGNGVFKPFNPKMPKLKLDSHEYWMTFPKDTIHRFKLRKGGLGFYQLYTINIDKKIREYEKQ